MELPLPVWPPAGVGLACRCHSEGPGLLETSPWLRSERTLQMDVSLPFELAAIEAALASCTKALDQETTDLERRAEPSLVRLSQRVSRRELENVKNYKAILNRLIVRVAKVKKVCTHAKTNNETLYSEIPGVNASICSV